nr:hypothetical protein [Tanacetum cinerariifolium]
DDKRECDLPICENTPVCDDHSDIFSDSKDYDDISVYDDFEDIEYVEASLFDPEIINVEEENVVQQEEEEVDLEDISQIQYIVLREKLLSITRLISNSESLNDNPNLDCMLNSFDSDNSLWDNFSPEFETFCDHTKETRSGNTTTHADNSLSDALNTKLLLINSNSQHLDKEEQEVKNVVEQLAKRGNRIEKSLQNFRVVHKSSISLNNTSQISLIHAVAPILSTKEPEYSP